MSYTLILSFQSRSEQILNLYYISTQLAFDIYFVFAPARKTHTNSSMAPMR